MVISTVPLENDPPPSYYDIEQGVLLSKSTASEGNNEYTNIHDGPQLNQFSNPSTSEYCNYNNVYNQLSYTPTTENCDSDIKDDNEKSGCKVLPFLIAIILISIFVVILFKCKDESNTFFRNTGTSHHSYGHNTNIGGFWSVMSKIFSKHSSNKSYSKSKSHSSRYKG